MRVFLRADEFTAEHARRLGWLSQSVFRVRVFTAISGSTLYIPLDACMLSCEPVVGIEGGGAGTVSVLVTINIVSTGWPFSKAKE